MRHCAESVKDERTVIICEVKDERTVIICDPNQGPEFSKLTSSPTIVQKVQKFKIHAQIKSKILTKHSFSKTKMSQFFSIN